MTGALATVEITDGFVRETAVPAADAASYVHLSLDDAYHPTGGYWFPSGEAYDGDTPGWVAEKGDIPHGAMIQYPCDDRGPEIVGYDGTPEWAYNRVVPGGDA